MKSQQNRIELVTRPGVGLPTTAVAGDPGEKGPENPDAGRGTHFVVRVNLLPKVGVM